MSNPISRRAFLALAGATFVHAADSEPPVSGVADAALAPFDKLLVAFVQKNKVPGASLAVTRQGKLVYARGFGYADRDRKRGVQPESLFRIASVSKPITAVAVLQLVEQKKLKLDDKVWGLLKLNPFLAKGEKIDPRWKDVTVLQCLQHTGGWDRDKSFDPIGRPWRIAKEMGIATPVSPVNVVRYVMGKPLDFAPGQRDAYSNLGYLVLGRLIANLGGKSYEACVREKVFAPLKVKTARLGRALVENRAKGEVLYYDSKGDKGRCLYPPRRGESVPQPDGADNFEAFEAHGGWIASAIDLVKFASAFDEPKKSPLLSEKTIQTMWARPDGAAGKKKDGRPRDAYYGCGWNVRPVGDKGKANLWHAGYVPGSEALLVRRHDGLNWAVLFNTTGAKKSLTELIDGKLHVAADQVKTWPGKDLFGTCLKG